MRLTFLVPLAVLIAAAPSAVAAQGRGTPATRPGAQPAQPAQQVVVRQGPVSSASADTLVQCVPIATPVKKEPVAKPVRRRPRVRPRPRPAATVAKPQPKPAPKPRPKTTAKPTHKRRRPVTHRPRPVVSAASNAPARANLPALVMCRPIRPVTPMSVGPLPETVVPIPQVASAAPPAAAIPVEEVPSYIAAAGPHSQFLPLALIPAFFIPFIHSGHNTPGADTTGITPPVDTTPPIPPGPPVDTTPPVLPPAPPPTTVPEPSSVAMLASGLIGLGGIAEQRRRKRKR